MDEQKIESLNPLTDTPTSAEPVVTDEVKPVEPINVEVPKEEVVLPTDSVSNNQNLDSTVQEGSVSENVETPVVEAEVPKPDVEVLDIDLNREKPTVVTEQVIDKVTEKKQENKASIVLVIAILLIVALAVIFIPQLSTLFK